MDSPKCCSEAGWSSHLVNSRTNLTDVDAGMQPFGARRTLVGFHDIAAEHDDRHAVAPRVVHRHGGVLQTDHAMARHGNRLASILA